MRISDWSSDVCSSDLSGFATGVALSGATDAVSVDFAGAALSVTSTGANATGITTQDGTDVTITTAANAATGNGAAVTVNAAGGLATGISIAGASGAESVTLGDAFTVTNSAGSATGIILTDGSSQTVLSGGLNVAGVSATGAQLTNASGAVTFTAGGPLSVDGGSGGTTGIVLADGTDQTTDLAGDLTVNANGGAAVDRKSARLNSSH